MDIICRNYGAALQLGGSIAQAIGKVFKLDAKNTKIMIMCGMAYYLVAVAIGYMESGYFGLYHSQRVKYSKMEPEEINQKVKE